jgi:hypothetical protein
VRDAPVFLHGTVQEEKGGEGSNEPGFMVESGIVLGYISEMLARCSSWINSISEEIDLKGPITFTGKRLARQDCLLAHRSALFFTPTKNIPQEWVGNGPVDISIPIVSPDYTDFFEIPSYRTPRFWVDLIQRQTAKLRWKPFVPARVDIIRYDYFQIRWDHLSFGVKALVDALKVRTTGRRDGRYLYYFGAILDDGPGFVRVHCDQRKVGHPKSARMRIKVTALVGSVNP